MYKCAQSATVNPIISVCKKLKVKFKYTCSYLMKEFIDFGKIVQFRNVVSDIIHDYIKNNERDTRDTQDSRDSRDNLPIIDVIGTEKIHGTNSAICFNRETHWVQSRNNILEQLKDNAECCKYANKNIESWKNVRDKLMMEYNLSHEDTIIIYYEWCGGNIQKKSCVSEVDKLSMIFTYFKVIGNKKTVWYETKCGNEWVSDISNRIYNINNFRTYNITIDFSSYLETELKKKNIEDIKKNDLEMERLTDYVENNSDVSRYFNKPDNIGEGIVWVFKYNNKMHRWKTKGEKHLGIKLKKTYVNDTTDVNDTKKEVINLFINDHCIKNSRLEGVWQKIFGINKEYEEYKIPDMKYMGDFIREFFKDVVEEESDILEKLNLKIKDISKSTTGIVRKWFIEKLKSEM